jgi:hypothetical protein
MIGNIGQNMAFAFLYNELGVPIAAAVFYRVFGWLLSPTVTRSLRIAFERTKVAVADRYAAGIERCIVRI